MEGDPLGEAEGPGQVRAHSGAVLALQVAGHREVVVLPNLEISYISRYYSSLAKTHLKVIGVHPVNRPLPVTAGLDNHSVSGIEIG